MIELTNVHKTLGNKPILQGVNLHVKAGETYVIIGRSGTGKSVTLKNIVGLLQPDQGEVRIMGENINNISAKRFYELRKEMGVLFQNGALINWLNVGQNISLPLIEHENFSENEIKKIVAEKLALVNLQGGAFNAVIVRRYEKRVDCTSHCRNPKIILYDEPTSRFRSSNEQPN